MSAAQLTSRTQSACAIIPFLRRREQLVCEYVEGWGVREGGREGCERQEGMEARDGASKRQTEGARETWLESGWKGAREGGS